MKKAADALAATRTTIAAATSQRRPRRRRAGAGTGWTGAAAKSRPPWVAQPAGGGVEAQSEPAVGSGRQGLVRLRRGHGGHDGRVGVGGAGGGATGSGVRFGSACGVRPLSDWSVIVSPC